MYSFLHFVFKSILKSRNITAVMKSFSYLLTDFDSIYKVSILIVRTENYTYQVL